MSGFVIFFISSYLIKTFSDYCIFNKDEFVITEVILIYEIAAS